MPGWSMQQCLRCGSNSMDGWIGSHPDDARVCRRCYEATAAKRIRIHAPVPARQARRGTQSQ